MPANPDSRELGAPLEAHRFDEKALNRYLADHIPGFAGDGEIRQFLGGQSNPTFLVDDSSGAYVLRKKPPGKLLPSAHAVDREYRVISALANSSVPVPRARLFCDDENIIGQVFYVMDYVPGRVFAEIDMPQCSRDERTALYLDAANVLGALHAVDYREVGLEDFGRPSNYVSRQVARWTSQYEASKVEESEAMDKLIAWLQENDPDDDLASIAHGDYRPGNLIYDADEPKVVAVLDWELSTIGHPLADVGYFLAPHRLRAEGNPFGLMGKDLGSLGIPSERALLEAYATSAGRDDVPSVDFYIAFAMFRLAAILAGVMKRGLDGNAADPRAVERGATYRALAESAWAIAAAE